MTPKETVLSLYRAYQSGVVEEISALLHPDVVWVAPPGNATQVALGLGRPEDAGPPNGSNNLDRDEIVRFMTRDFGRFFLGAKNSFGAVVAEGNIVVVEHRLSAELPNKRRYMNDYCFIYEVVDGKVRAIREYMDTRGGWAQVFGDDEPGRLLDPPLER